MQVASKFGHARPLGSRIVHYVHNGQTKATERVGLLVGGWEREHNNMAVGMVNACMVPKSFPQII